MRLIFTAILAMQAAGAVAAGPAPATLEGVVWRLVEQSPILAVVLWMWVRQSNRDEARQTSSDKRYEDLVERHVELSERMVQTMQKLSDSLDGKINDCPLKAGSK